MARILLDEKATRQLLADWVVRLGSDYGYEFGARGGSSEKITIGDQKAFHIWAEVVEGSSDLMFIASDPSEQESIDRINQLARDNVTAGDFGGIVWYSPTLQEIEFKMSAHSPMSDLVLRLSNQTRIDGWRRLSSVVLLEFTEEQPDNDADKQHLFAPKATVKVHMAIPGPTVGLFSASIATNMIELVAAICSFALGRPLQLPAALFATKQDQVADLDAKRVDASILTLARKSVSLDVFGNLARMGDLSSFRRVRAALLTFDAAMNQDRDPVASILYVIAAEAITTPSTSWRSEKLTTRFVRFFEELMPGDLDEIIAHANFEQAMGLKRGNKGARKLRRELLDAIYAHRSSLVHFGVEKSYFGMNDMSSLVEIRRAILSDFAEMAILRFLESPRESLIGHPTVDAAFAAANDSGAQKPE